MTHDREDLEYLMHLLEDEYAIFRDFLTRRTGDPGLAGELLQQAIATALASEAGLALSSGKLAGCVLSIALRSLRHRDKAERARAARAMSDAQAVLADARELLSQGNVSDAMIEAVIDSFARPSHRDIVRSAFRRQAALANPFDESALDRAATRILFRAHRRLRIAMYQQEFRSALFDPALPDASLAAAGARALKRRARSIVAESGNASFDLEAWLVKWIKKTNPALGNQRPEDCLRTVAGQQRMSDEHLREGVRREQDRLQLRSLLLEEATGAPTKPVDEAYFEELLRQARGE